MKTTDKPKRSNMKNLDVKPDDAANVKGGWFFAPFLQVPTKTVTVKTDGIAGESLDGIHKGELEIER